MSIEVSKIGAVPYRPAAQNEPQLPAEPQPVRVEPVSSSATAAQVQAEIKPPVDQDRVAEIRAALGEGRYPLIPTQIADAMIAARFMFIAPE